MLIMPVTNQNDILFNKKNRSGSGPVLEVPDPGPLTEVWSNYALAWTLRPMGLVQSEPRSVRARTELLPKSINLKSQLTPWPSRALLLTCLSSSTFLSPTRSEWIHLDLLGFWLDPLRFWPDSDQFQLETGHNLSSVIFISILIIFWVEIQQCNISTKSYQSRLFMSSLALWGLWTPLESTVIDRNSWLGCRHYEAMAMAGDGSDTMGVQ